MSIVHNDMYFYIAISIIIAVVGIACVVISLSRYYKVNKTVNRLEKMLDDVINNRFKEDSFDETKISKLESKMADFLSQSSLSSKNIETEQERIKSLIADISHQTKTPVANIMLYSELLNECELNDDSIELVKQITRQSEKLDFLISSLVKASRLENGIIAVSPKTQDIVPMINDVIEAVNSNAAAKNISINSDNSECLEAVFDRKWTFEAIYNILDNAVKYTNKNGYINIKFSEYEMFLRIDISDNGIGISEDEISKIFLRFYRSAAVSEQEGVGIGLYLARSIITAEDGYIKVSSELGKGTTFSVYLKK